MSDHGISAFNRSLPRRDLLRLGVLGAGGLAALAACGKGRGIGASSSAGASTTTAASSGAASAAAPAPAAPAVANAAAAKKFAGQTVVTQIPGFGTQSTLVQELATKFQADTGIKMQSILLPKSTSDGYAGDQRFLSAGEATPDVLLVDLIYPPALGNYLLDLTTRIDNATKKANYPNLISVNTVGGKLIALPWYGGFGRLWYRTDLMSKYGLSAPPATWPELVTMAKKIQAGEQATNKQFNGYVFQGSAYEGLTCNALEWVASYGGGTFIDTNQKVTVQNPQTLAALKMAQSWIGSISPSSVTSFTEDEAHSAFGSGNAAFMRNWEYSQDLQTNSDIAGKLASAPLPAGLGTGATTAATAGGWAAGVNKDTKSTDAAVEWLKYITGAEAQTFMAINAGNVPSLLSVAADPAVQKALPPLKERVNPVGRPTSVGVKYNQASTIIFQNVNKILRGSDVTRTVSTMANQLNNLVG